MRSSSDGKHIIDKDLERSGIGDLWMKRFVTAEDLSFRAGFGKREPKTSSEGVYWYHEFLHIMSGKGEEEFK